MSTEDLRTTEDQQKAMAGTVAEQAEKAAEAAASAGSADVDVSHFLDEYTDITDTMVSGKKDKSATMVRDRTAMTGTMVKDKTDMSGTMIKDRTAMSGTMVKDKTDMSGTMIKDRTAMTGTMVKDKTAMTGTMVKDKTAMTGTIVTDRVTQTGAAKISGEEPGKKSEDTGEEKTVSKGLAAESDPETEAIKEKIRERKREKIRRQRARRIRFWTISILILLCIVLGAFSLSGFFTVDSIEVKGNSHFTAEEIINIGHAVPGHNLIYNPGKQEIKDYLEANPYIKQADVTRKFPSTLVITVSEREQACAFRYDDDYLIMDDEGILLKKTRTEPMITMIEGFVVSKIKLGETIGTQNQKMFGGTLRLIRAMKAADMYFVRIDMTAYEEDSNVRAYIYDNLVVRSSYSGLMDNLENGRLHKVVEKLFEDDVKRGTIIIAEDGSISFEPGI